MDKLDESAREEVSMNMTPIIIAIVVGFIIAVIFVFLRRKSSGRRDFLLTGLCDSGKTALFMQLMHNKMPDTFTSITENLGEYRAGRMSGRLVDIPGHYRVREKYFDKYKHTARGIVYVVDSVTAQKDIRDVADALYTVLADKATQSCPILVLCNKQDNTTAKGAQVIKSILEKEMNIVRDTRSRKLQSVGEDDSNAFKYLGKEGRDFEFAHVHQNVQFFECSAKQKQLDHFTDWIDRML